MSAAAAAPARKPGWKGFAGPGGGAEVFVDNPSWWRGTSVQVCGIWPWGVGSSTPMIGVPMGQHLMTGASVCFDPISWYTRAKLISTPSAFILGEPGLGKSTAVRRMLLGLAARGVTPFVLGDLKGEYVQLIKALGGQVIRLAAGADRINPLDVGDWQSVVAKVDETTARTFKAGVIDRRTQVVAALATLMRTTPLTPVENSVLAAAIRLLTEREGAEQPVLSDVFRVIDEAPDEVRRVTYTAPEDADRYRTVVTDLQQTLLAILEGPLGATFDGATTTPIDPTSAALCVDISDIDENDILRSASTLITVWSAGFAAINTAHVLADAGLAPQRTFFSVLDEMWRVLQSGSGLISRINALTRLNRHYGTGVVMCSHSMMDLQSMEAASDRAKARGFADRSAVMLIAASTDEELDAISKVRALSRAEREAVGSWSSPPGWDSAGEAVHVGRGKFLIKVGGRPGIPVQLVPTPDELRLGDTDFRWSGR